MIEYVYVIINKNYITFIKGINIVWIELNYFDITTHDPFRLNNKSESFVEAKV